MYSLFFNLDLPDLHCSSEDDEADDDMMEEVKGDYNDSSMIDDGQTQVAAAEAMMQLGSFPCFSALSSGMQTFAVDVCVRYFLFTIAK